MNTSLNKVECSIELLTGAVQNLYHAIGTASLMIERAQLKLAWIRSCNSIVIETIVNVIDIWPNFEPFGPKICIYIDDSYHIDILPKFKPFWPNVHLH